MLKNVSSLGKVLTLPEQKKLQGGLSPSGGVVCRSPQFNADSTCPAGTHPHPTHGVCICCQD
ncbi:hypothetical protein [Spongiimicrobium salis]|uniref:hypothetical protein n=1 Tax=Spongiimicrobium salis TaxID=1667022 RepID=UPI00374D3758